MDEYITPFVDALSIEIQILGKSNPHMPVGTIYFGGGTPSLLTSNQFAHLLDIVRSSFEILDNAEICIESNPNDLHAAYLQELKAIGINRLSIGMQSAQQSELTLFKREHDQQMVEQAVKAARQASFENISLDLIFGIPNQNLDDWQVTLRAALSMQVEHISIYGLTLEGGTSLKNLVDTQQLPEPDDDLAADMYELATSIFQIHGYEQYEISNWTKPSYESQHNLQYWRNLQYAGLGPGAHGYAAGIRTIVMRYPQRYIEALTTYDKTATYEFPRTPAISKATKVDRQTEISETIMMGLRLTKEGIQRTAFRQRFGVDIVEMHSDTIEKFVSLGFLHLDETCLRLTSAGRLLSNRVIGELI